MQEGSPMTSFLNACKRHIYANTSFVSVRLTKDIFDNEEEQNR